MNERVHPAQIYAILKDSKETGFELGADYLKRLKLAFCWLVISFVDIEALIKPTFKDATARDSEGELLVNRFVNNRVGIRVANNLNRLALSQRFQQTD